MEANEEGVEETTKPIEQIDESQFDSAGDESVIKIDLAKPPTPQENETTEDNADDSGVVDGVENADTTQEQEEVHEEAETQEAEDIAEEAAEAIEEAETTGEPLPENIQKLVDFMSETGGDINDYVSLNTSVEDMDDSEVLKDFYKKTKKHLSNEDIDFLLEDTFSYDEDMDDEKDVRRKKLALKERVAEGRNYLDKEKSKYYEDIKSGSKLTTDQQDKIEFYDKYNQDEERDMGIVKQQQATFLEKTDKFFNNEFKGFEFSVGDAKMSYDISNIDDVKNKQVDINNFVGKFLKEGLMEDAAGYHKALFTAMNPDAVAKHFYEQGKSDAIKRTISDTKNINTSRESHKVYEHEGVKFKVLGESGDGMKLRMKKGRK